MPNEISLYNDNKKKKTLQDGFLESNKKHSLQSPPYLVDEENPVTSESTTTWVLLLVFNLFILVFIPAVAEIKVFFII